MTDPIDSQKAADIVFDLTNSAIIAELEDGGKDLSYLASKSGLSEDEILSRLCYLIETGIMTKSTRDGSVHLSADPQKLSDIVESDGNFDATMQGLAKMDSYLN